MSNLINAAVAEMNKQNEQKLISEGIRLLSAINEKQTSIKEAAARIVELQRGLSELNGEFATVETIFGGAIPAGANAETISKVIDAQNKAKQFPVEQKANRLTAAILAERDTIAAFNKQLEELRKKLAELNATTATVEQITN